MEKVFFNSRGLKLCGVLHAAGNSKEVVVMVHGYSSGKDSPTYVKFEQVLGEKGLNSFRFDLAGNYESEGDFAEQTISTMVSDVEAAVDMLKRKGFTIFDLIGSSGGGLASMVYALKHEVKKLALIAPVSDYPAQRRLKYGDVVLKEWKGKGFIYYDAARRGLLKVNYSFYQDAEKHVMREKAAGIKCPVFIVHGDKDEQVTLQDSQELVKFLPNAKLYVFKGAGHRFLEPGQKEKVVKLITNWLVRKP